MPSYSKGALKKMGAKAAKSHFSKGASLSEAVEKVARQRSLSGDQVERVCEFANHAANATYMRKEAYTDFELANPDEVSVQEKTASSGTRGGLTVASTKTGGEAPEMDKTASAEEGPALGTEAFLSSYDDTLVNDFQKIAGSYGLEFDPERARREQGYFASSVGALAQRSLEELEMAKTAMDQSLEEVYSHVKESLLSGIPIEKIAKELKENGQGQALEAIWPRLEAEYLVRTSNYDDAGPFSEQRSYKTAANEPSEEERAQMTSEQAYHEAVLSRREKEAASEAGQIWADMFELSEDGPLSKAASSAYDSALDARLHFGVVDYALCAIDDLEKEARQEKKGENLDKEALSPIKALGDAGKKAFDAVGKKLKKVDNYINSNAGLADKAIYNAGKAGVKGAKETAKATGKGAIKAGKGSWNLAKKLGPMGVITGGFTAADIGSGAASTVSSKPVTPLV